MPRMSALHYIAPGRLEWREIDRPAIQESTDALVKPVAVAACDLDPEIVRGNVPFPAPFVLGHEFVGRIDELGDDVDGLGVGDRVLVSFQPSCGQCLSCRRGLTASCEGVPPTSMYGVGAVSGDWGGAFSELVRVPHAGFNLAKLPDNVMPIQAASASDNLADAHRAVAPYLAKYPDQSVLIAGTGSIALYAVLWARALGAARVTFAAPPSASLTVAGRLDADVVEVTEWPSRFDKHDITVNCSTSAAALEAVVNSTRPQGDCVNCSIPFHGQPDLPLLKWYMSGIHFHTGRVNGAASMNDMLAAISNGTIDPDKIEPVVVTANHIATALPEFQGSKLIAVTGE